MLTAREYDEFYETVRKVVVAHYDSAVERQEAVGWQQRRTRSYSQKTAELQVTFSCLRSRFTVRISFANQP